MGILAADLKMEIQTAMAITANTGALRRLQEEYLTEEEVAVFYGISVAGLRNRASKGIAPPHVRGTRPKRYAIETLKAYLKKSEQKAS